MSGWEQELDALLGQLADEDLSAADKARLNEILRDEPAAREMYHRYLDVHTGLQEHLAEPDFSALDPVLEPEIVPAPATNYWRWGLAAAAVILLTILFLPSEQAPAAVATIRSLDGAVKLIHPDGREQLNPKEGAPIQAGSVIETLSTEAFVELEFPDKTLLTLSKPSVLRLRLNGDRQILNLARGNLWADVKPRPTHAPLIIQTPTAWLRVLGTIFDVEADPDSSRLRVASGRVRMTRLVDAAETEVTKNHEAVATLDGGGEFKAIELPRQVKAWQSNFPSEDFSALVDREIVKPLEAGQLTEEAAAEKKKRLARKWLARRGAIVHGKWLPPEGKLKARVRGKKFLIPREAEPPLVFSVIALSIRQYESPPVLLQAGTRFRFAGHQRLEQEFGIYFATKNPDGTFAGKYYLDLPLKTLRENDGQWTLTVGLGDFRPTCEKFSKTIAGQQLADFGLYAKTPELGVDLYEAAVVAQPNP